MAVSIDEARHVARLARVDLSDEALVKIASELSTVLDHFASLAGITDEPDSLHPFEASDPPEADHAPALRTDEPGETLSREDTLAGAPVTENGQFSVPGFLPDES